MSAAHLTASLIKSGGWIFDEDTSNQENPMQSSPWRMQPEMDSNGEYARDELGNIKSTTVRNEGYVDPRSSWRQAGGAAGITKGVYNKVRDINDTVSGFAGRYLAGGAPALASQLTSSALGSVKGLALNAGNYWDRFMHGNSGGRQDYKYYETPKPQAPTPKGFWAGVHQGGQDLVEGAKGVAESITAPLVDRGENVTSADSHWSDRGQITDTNKDTRVIPDALPPNLRRPPAASIANTPPKFGNKPMPTVTDSNQPGGVKWNHSNYEPPVANKPPAAGAYKPQTIKMSAWHDFITRPALNKTTFGADRIFDPATVGGLLPAPEHGTLGQNLRKVPGEWAFGKSGPVQQTVGMLGMIPAGLAARFGNSLAPMAFGAADSARNRPYWERVKAYVPAAGADEAGFHDWWSRKLGDPNDPNNRLSASLHSLVQPVGEAIHGMGENIDLYKKRWAQNRPS